MIARGLNEKEFRYLLLSYTGYGFGLNVLNRVGKSAIFVLNRVREPGRTSPPKEYPPRGKGVPFLSEIVYKMVRGWTGGRNSPYKTLLSVPHPHPHHHHPSPPTPHQVGLQHGKSQSIIMQTVDTQTLNALDVGMPRR